MRIGHSIDIHPFDESKQTLILGGISFEHTGLKGHSDADVLLHVVAESILGALALGDLGTHFPDTDPSYLGKASSYFVSEVIRMSRDKGFIVGNIDCMILLEEPKLKPMISKMREYVANLLLIETNQVSIKATTAEHLGFVGKKEGILASATVLMEEI